MGEVFGVIFVAIVVAGPLIWQIVGDQRDRERARNERDRS